MNTQRVDVAIVGAGTAGLAALREVRKHTENFLVIHDGPLGTTCARVGCMPSKALIAAANAFYARNRLEPFGITGGDKLTANISAVLRRVRALRDHFVAGVLEATSKLGSRMVVGRARLDGKNRLIVGDETVEARQIVLAPGSSPIVPRTWRSLGDRILTSDSLFEQSDLPRRIGVIGLGAIGVEVAQALARLGVEIHAFDGAAAIGGLSDDKVSRAACEFLAGEFTLKLGVEVELAGTDGGIEIRSQDDRVSVDKIVAAVGRRPNTAGLGLETLGVPLDKNGMPEVDPETMRIGDTSVLLAGDADGNKPLLHEGSDEGHIAGLNATSSKAIRLSRRTPLSIVFSDPEIAMVGQRFSDLDQGAQLVGEVDFAKQGRARIAQENKGLLRIYAARQGGRLLGAEMAAPAAEHMAHLLALAIDRSLTVHDLLRMPFYHPTLEEGLRTALRQLTRGLPPCSVSDLAGCGPLNIESLE
jgi:dihydrolipoamide dehydrogenase